MFTAGSIKIVDRKRTQRAVSRAKAAIIAINQLGRLVFLGTVVGNPHAIPGSASGQADRERQKRNDGNIPGHGTDDKLHFVWDITERHSKSLTAINPRYAAPEC